ncbi:MAG: L,D-transpeptidase [Campylobacterales bacterium]
MRGGLLLLACALWLTAGERLVVSAKNPGGFEATLSFYENQTLIKTYDAVVGKNGIAAPGKKREGDGKTPSGTYAITELFGLAEPADATLPFLEIGPELHCVDDGRSRHYNRIIDSRLIERDYQSHEVMLEPNGLYDLGAVIEYNPEGKPGAGSCIFLHIAREDGGPTAGCVALQRDDLFELIDRLKDADNPVIEIRP